MVYHLPILKKCINKKVVKIKTDYIIVMKNTRKKQNNKKTVKRKSRNNKKGGATTTFTSTVDPLKITHNPSVLEEVAPEKMDLETRSLEELAKIKENREIANQEIVEDASNIAKGVAVNTLETVGDLIGVDIDNTEAVNQKLEDIKETFTDPKNLETLKETVAEAAEKGAVIVEAASPLIDPLADKALDVGAKTATKLADTGTTIFFNFIKEIPGVGLAYALIQNATKVGEASSAVVNATAELATDTADSAVVFKKNLEELQKEGIDTENRTTQAIKEFETPYKNISSETNQILSKPIISYGGKKTTTKKNVLKNKYTKRVRFAV